MSKSALATSVCAALVLAAHAAPAAARDETFSESTVREDVAAYLRILVAPAAPPLSVFYRFHGHHDESEFEYELRECRQRWNQGLVTVDGQPDLEPECKQFVRDRGARSSEVPSLYLRALRSALGSPGAGYHLGSIRRVDASDVNAAFLVEATVGSHTVQISHAANPTYADLGLLGVVLVDGGSFAGPAPPPPASAGDAIAVPPTTSRDLVRSIRLGGFTARFERTPLREIADALGGGVIGHSGDASASRRWLCYSLPGQLLWLVSTPMGGSDAQLVQVVAETVSDSDPRAESCAPVLEANQPISLEFGWLGTSEAELHRNLGPPSGARGEWQLFFFRGKAAGPYRSPSGASSVVDFDVSAYVEVKIVDGNVDALRASHVTSY